MPLPLPPAVAQPALPARSTLEQLYSALTRGDTAALSPLLAPDLAWTSVASGTVATRAGLLAQSAALAALPRPAGYPPLLRVTLDSVRVRAVAPGVAAAEYLRTDERPLGTGSATTTYRSRALAVFAWRDGGWRLTHHTQTWLRTPSGPAALDSAAQQAFVGRYAIAPGAVDDVRWERGALVATLTGQAAGARLVPVSGSTFVPDGAGLPITFERDAAGRVTGYVQGFPDGQVRRARRLP